MEAFSLLKYWRTGGGGGPGGATATAFAAAKATTKTIVDGTAAGGISPYSSESEDGPYFDLEFALPDHESDTDEQEQTTAELHENDVVKTEDDTESEEISVHENDDDDEEEEDEAELKFSLTSNECTDQNAALSPSDDLFFKGDLVTIEPSSILLNGAEEENPKFPVFLGKSASKFRVLLLKLKKSKSVNGENPETPDSSGTPPKIVERENQGKTTSGKFFVKFKVEEAPPLVNLFTRDNSSKEIHGKAPTKLSGGGGVEDSEANSVSDERKLSKEVMNKYLKMVKPFYIRVSKRYVEKLKFPGGGGGSKGCAAALSPEGNVKNSQQKQGKNLQAGLKVVRKHLGKSRSASASASAAAAPPASDRRDDSLLQLQDGIQGAILHCKKSFNASRDVDSSSILCRSVSDPSHEKCVTLPKFSRASSSTSGSEAKKSGLDNI